VPRYDYKCNTCYSVVEFERSIGDDTQPICCSKLMNRQWGFAPTAIFNGSGFYSTDNRN